MDEALSHPHTDDRYVVAAANGMLGAIMPSPNEIRGIAFGHVDGVDDIEALLKSLGHGGGAASLFYLTEQPSDDYVKRTLPYSLEMLDIAWHCTAMSAAAAAQIAKRLDLPMTYEGADELFGPNVIEQAENAAMRNLTCISLAIDMVWGACVGSAVSLANSPNVWAAENSIHFSVSTWCWWMAWRLRGWRRRCCSAVV
jgi:hypothetical protein